MKATKKLLAVILSVILIVSVCPLGVFTFTASAETEGYFIYTVSDGETCITGVNSSISGDVIIPSELGGYPVTSIGYYPFYGCTKLTSVKIPDSVTSIGDWAFYGCTGLTTITIPNSVTSIGTKAFYGCIALSSVTIPDSVTSIGDSAFAGSIGLTEVTIGNSVMYMNNVFKDCTEIGKVNYTGSIADWCKISFASGSSNPIYYAHNLYIDNELVVDLNIPNTVSSINNYAFSGCTGLASANIADSVSSIGHFAFANCNDLASIEFPDSLTEIGVDAFSNTAWYNNQSKGLVYAGKVAYRYNGNCPSNVTIKEDTRGIAGGAFFWCTNLNSITIPNSVISIGWYAFCECTGLTEVTIPNSVTEIGVYAFRECTKLRSVIIGNSNAYDNLTTSIGESAFAGCTDLASITIGNSVTSIGLAAFEGCTSLTSVKIPELITSISRYAFQGCSGLIEVIIPNSISLIDNNAFYNCTALTDIYYAGTEQQRLNVEIGEGNKNLINATWHYNYVPPCEHSNVEWKTAVKPTLNENGLKKEICLKCGEILGVAEIPALGFTYDIENAPRNAVENISVAASATSNLPETVEIIVQKSEITEDSITYEIHLENEGAEIQPDAPVLVKVPIPAGLDKDKLNVYRREPDGSKTRMDIIIDGDFAYFETEYFSIYEIIEKLCGDINNDGNINNKDLTRLFQHLSEWDVEVSNKALDVNGDGKINNKDLTRLFQYLSDWDVEIF